MSDGKHLFVVWPRSTTSNCRPDNARKAERPKIIFLPPNTVHGSGVKTIKIAVELLKLINLALEQVRIDWLPELAVRNEFSNGTVEALASCRQFTSLQVGRPNV